MTVPGVNLTPEGVVLAVLLQPRASRTEIVGWQGAELKVRVTAPPVEGAANQLLCDYFAKLLGIAKGRVRLQSGETSRHKRLLFENVTSDELIRVLPGLSVNSSE